MYSPNPRLKHALLIMVKHYMFKTLVSMVLMQFELIERAINLFGQNTFESIICRFTIYKGA